MQNNFYDSTHVQAVDRINPTVDRAIDGVHEDEFVFVNKAAGNLNLTLPAGVIGTRIKGLILVTGTLTFIAAGSDKIHWQNANASASVSDINGTSIFCNELYACIELFFADTNKWVVWYTQGDWSLGS